MEMIDIYIPSDVIKNKENYSAFYSFYEEQSMQISFDNLSDKQFKQQLIDKAEEMNEPNLVEYIKNNI